MLSYVTDQSGAVQAVSGIVNLVVFISGFAVGVKRLHDRDKSGWYLLLFYIVPGVLFGAAFGVHADHGGLHASSPASSGWSAFAIMHLGVCRAGLPARHRRRQPFRPRSADAGGDATASPDAGLTEEFAGLTRRAKHLIF